VTAGCRLKIFRGGRKAAARIPCAFEPPVESAVLREEGVHRNMGTAAQQLPLGLRRTLAFMDESIGPNTGICPMGANARLIARPAIANERDAASLNVRVLGRCAVMSMEPRGTICGAA